MYSDLPYAPYTLALCSKPNIYVATCVLTTNAMESICDLICKTWPQTTFLTLNKVYSFCMAAVVGIFSSVALELMRIVVTNLICKTKLALYNSLHSF